MAFPGRRAYSLGSANVGSTALRLLLDRFKSYGIQRVGRIQDARQCQEKKETTGQIDIEGRSQGVDMQSFVVALMCVDVIIDTLLPTLEKTCEHGHGLSP